MKEIWKDIEGYEGLYQVSSWGRVRSLDRYVSAKCGGSRLVKGIIIKEYDNGLGYKLVALCRDNKPKYAYVHRLVAAAFVANPEGYDEINHIDEDKGNNVPENLEWCSHKYNMNYGNRMEKVIEKHLSSGRWNPELVGLSKEEYKRSYSRMYYAAHKEEIKEYNRSYSRMYYEAHKEEIKERNRRYKEEKKEEKMKEKMKEKMLKDGGTEKVENTRKKIVDPKEYHKEYNHKWYQENKEKRREYMREYLRSRRKKKD